MKNEIDEHGLDTFEVEGAWSNEDRADITRSRGGEPCVICGRRVSSNAWTVHFVGGGPDALATFEEDRYTELGSRFGGSDMGSWPIGSECAKHVPLKYRTRIQ